MVLSNNTNTVAELTDVLEDMSSDLVVTDATASEDVISTVNVSVSTDPETTDENIDEFTNRYQDEYVLTATSKKLFFLL